MIALVAQYFLNHRLDPAEIEWQMEEFARAGYQGVYAHARQGLLTPYMSEEWWRALDTMIAACRRTGLQFWIWDEDYFPSGTAGGRIVWEDPGLVARGLELSVTRLSGPGPFTVDFPPGMLLRAFALEVLPDGRYGPALDVTPYCGTRRQQWTERRILHHAYSPLIHPVAHPHWRDSMEQNRFALSWQPPHTGDTVVVAALVQSVPGVHIDILRPEGIRRFLELSHEQYFARYGAEFGQTIGAAFTDEPSPGGPLYPWTPRFPEEFRADHGYDLLEHLPHLALDLDERSFAVRHHYRLTQHRLQREHYVAQIARWCEEHGILMTGHLTRTEWLSLVATWWPNELRCYQPMHIPTCDPLGASWGWTAQAAYHSGLKVASSAAHLFGRAQASSDALAVVGDEVSLRDLKAMLDYQMVLGINHFSVHGLSYSLDGPRKDEVPPSLFYQHTEWKHMRTLLDYVRQTCEALTGGDHYCEIAVLYPSTSLACQARPGINYYNLPDEAQIHALVEQLLSHQRDFDFIDETTLQESVDDHGALNTAETYRTILLPYLRAIDARTASALLRFARAGGRVIAVGQMPLAIGAHLDHALHEWAGPSIEFLPELDAAALGTLPGAYVEGEGARDVFVLRRRKGDELLTFAYNRREVPFEGQVDDAQVRIPGRGSILHASPVGRCGVHTIPPLGETTVVADWSTGWEVSFEPNQLPLSFWHVTRDLPPPAGPVYVDAPFSGPGFDLMARQPDPAGEGSERVRYACRFLLTGEIPDARLVMEDSTLAGEWEVRVNGILVEGWQRAVVFDCRNLEAPVGDLLLGGTTPTLNLVTMDAWGPGRGLREVPYLYGAFACEYRYGHLSFPFVQGPESTRALDGLLPWDVLGRPTFSGSAIYRRTIEVPEGDGWILDLGRVEDVAAVSLDGEAVAVLAWPPYQCALDGIRPGQHTLCVEVTNPPANRNRAAGLPAGLLGPVRLLRRR